ncbi:MAG: tyrosine-type recombinase/integrase [Xanthobacteraceae bacterium]
MAKVATQLKPAPRGGFIARKSIPRDVAEAYGKLFETGRPQWEAWFNSGPVSLLQARAKHREWSSDIEVRIANIRAERKGEGQTLTPQGARALAGEWYKWFVLQMAAKKWSGKAWRDYRDGAWDGLYGATDPPGRSFDDVDMDYLRPFIADEAKTAQFLAAKRAQFDLPSRDMFLDYVTQDFFAALDTLVRRAEGDFGEDQYAKRFPKQGEGVVDPDLTPWSLFEKWIAEAKPATATVDRWRGVFLKLQADFPNTSAAALLPEQAHEWAKGLINTERTAVTVRDVWVNASRVVFAWAIGAKLVARNPFTGWRITVPKKSSTRETKAFTESEISTILKAAMKIEVRSKMDAAKRWCPWLAAYTGARMGELTQLRGSDVFEHDGIWAIKISPEAGSVKNRKSRTVPLHEHLIKQGFVEFVKASGKGPLFYNEAKAKVTADIDPTNPKRPRAVKARERVASWVREIGISDPELQPNHAWRHTFKKLGDRAGLSEKMLDVICGHAPANVGRSYGEPELADKAEALRRFPRFKV